MKAILAALGVLALATAASAETLKVPAQYETIQEAVNAAAEGDTIVVARGVYYESVTVGTPNLTIIGKKAVIDSSLLLSLTVNAASFYTAMNINAPGVTVQGFTFRNGSYHIQVYSDDCRILKCTFRNSGTNAVHVGSYNGTEVSGCRFVGTGGYGIYVAGSSGTSGSFTRNTILQTNSGGIYVSGGMNAVVDRNVVNGTGNGQGIYVFGSGAVVTGNRATDIASTGIEIHGQGATVLSNRVSWVSNNTGIYVDSASALVQGNSVTVARDLFECYGSGNQILDNKASGALGNGAGFYIGGDDIEVIGNVAQHIVEGGSAFYVYNYSGSGGGTIADNRAEDADYGGFYFGAIYGMAVRDCVAVRCGNRGDRAGFYVYGSSTTFENLVAQDCHGNGFLVNATNDTFTGCVAKGTTINGFWVYGTGNAFVSCSATGGDGQGFHNSGQGTGMTGGVYTGNRLDVANDVLGGATFAMGLGGAVVGTGGLQAEAQVYWYD
jgi:hypothetical protein